jgi:hypothetical protein
MDQQARGDHRHPTVVTLTPVGKHGLDKAAAWQARYQLTLWCEHADHRTLAALGITLGSSYG